MEYNFKKWVKGDTLEEHAKLSKIDSEFGKLIEQLKSYKVDRESIFIYGLFNLLEYLHIDRDENLFHRLRVLLEAYVIFLRMRSRYKEFPLPRANIRFDDLTKQDQVKIFTVVDRMSDGSGECYNLITTLSEYVEEIANEKQNYRKNFGIFETKH